MGRAPTSSSSTSSSGLKKGPWTADEDLKLKEYIQQHGAGNWRILPEKAGLERCGKSCRLRWTNYLRPDIKRGRFSFDEEEAIIQLHSILGNKWSAIAARLPGRTDNEIKNYWNTHIRKRLLRMGLDPVTHAPRLDLFLASNLSQVDSLSNLLYVLNQQQQQMANPQLLNIVTALLSNNQQQNQYIYNENNYTSSFLQQPAQGFSTSSNSMDDLSGLVSQETDYSNAVGSASLAGDMNAMASGFGSLRNSNNNKQQLSSNSTPFTSYASSPFDSSCYTSNGGLSTYDEIDSVLNFEIPEGFDLSELLY